MRKSPASRNAPSGYSGTPLWQKLGLKPGLRVALADVPDDYWTLCGFDSVAVEIATSRGHVDFAHAFAQSRAQLAKQLHAFVKRLEASGTLWISWPKKSSGVTTDLSEDVLRELALPLGLVDVKVCAVDATWSGLKFVWRRSVRK